MVLVEVTYMLELHLCEQQRVAVTVHTFSKSCACTETIQSAY